ncbi:MAG: NAD(P)H-dependent oxidoreductase [Bacteriovoracaceae bacterium]|nr:NAD(P)H-dependent oxidoreductase [Bacteriovoracaceae bacterium]
MKKITIIAGSNGKNLVLAKQFEEHLKSLGHQATLIDLVAADLPLFSPAQYGKLEGAKVIEPFKEALNAEKYVFVSPEYNGANTPVLSNFIAWCSTSSKDWRIHFNGKRAAIATHSGGDGLQALVMMRLQLSYMGMTVVGRQINISNHKPLDPNTLADVCQQLLA